MDCYTRPKMEYKNPEIAVAAKKLMQLFEKTEDKRQVLRAPELAALYDRLKTIPAGKQRAEFGREVNSLKQKLEQMAREANQPKVEVESIDVTAPFDVNTPKPRFLP